jgi:hypothetical protein
LMVSTWFWLTKKWSFGWSSSRLKCLWRLLGLGLALIFTVRTPWQFHRFQTTSMCLTFFVRKDTRWMPHRMPGWNRVSQCVTNLFSIIPENMYLSIKCQNLCQIEMRQVKSPKLWRFPKS